MIDAHGLRQVSAEQKKLGRYMFNYLAMMMAISSIFLVLANTPEALGKKTQLWEYLRTVDSGLYHKMKYLSLIHIWWMRCGEAWQTVAAEEEWTNVP